MATFENFCQLFATYGKFRELMQCMVIFGIFATFDIFWQHPEVKGNDFLDLGNGNRNSSAHSQILVTGKGMKDCIPIFWEWERE